MTRKVLIKTTSKGNFDTPGIFHGFGFSAIEFANGGIQDSIGIIELNDGTVKSVCVDWIKFDDVKSHWATAPDRMMEIKHPNFNSLNFRIQTELYNIISGIKECEDCENWILEKMKEMQGSNSSFSELIERNKEEAEVKKYHEALKVVREFNTRNWMAKQKK